MSRVLASSRRKRGVALLAVLLILVALFVLCAPFLSTVTTADTSAARMTDRAEMRIALDTAGRHARSRLGSSHPSLDPTPYFDAADELTVDNLFPPGFLDASDPNGVMWDVEATDHSGLIDLNSCPPQMLGNLLGGLSNLSKAIENDDAKAKVTRVTGFQPEGFVWISNELVGYTAVDGNELTGLLRGVSAVEPDEEGNIDPCGPRPSLGHPQGALVMDQRLLAIPEWRINGPEFDFRAFSTIEEVLDAEKFVIAEAFAASDVRTLRRVGTVYGDIGAGQRWSRPVRVRSEVNAGEASCRIQVEETRSFNAGTTIRITDGQTTEYGIVRRARGAVIELWEPLQQDYLAYQSEMSALIRRPVNVNTASREVLMSLVKNLKLLGSTGRVTTSEAEQFVDHMLDMRPFDGFSDFLERLLLPAAGLDVPERDGATPIAELSEEERGFLDPLDAIAIYKNAINSNDLSLDFSTMPMSFSSRDVYGIDVRASINAKSGVQRVAGWRSEVHQVVPQLLLMELFHRQKDFDDEHLNSREAPGWITGPVPTRRYDPRSASPSESRAHLGPFDPSLGEQSALVTNQQTVAASGNWVEPPPAALALPSRADEIAWAQPAPVRADEENTGGGLGWPRAGRVMHFDYEQRDLEGHFLPDQAFAFSPDDDMLNWVDDNGFTKPVYGSMWLQPRSLGTGEMFFDLSGSLTDADRISLLVDEGDLVLRVFDGAGDHPETVLREVGEVRYPLAGDGPGMPLDCWSHVQFEVRGNRPDQLTLLVDGKWNVETPGLTRLSSNLGPGDQAIVVESTEGFPDQCVIRIGDELIEVERVGDGGFSALYQSTGANCGFGGRAARESYLVQGEDADPVNFGANSKALTYQTGTPVELYGYSLSFRQNQYVPTQSSTLPATLGPWSVCYCTGVLRNGEVAEEQQMEQISFNNVTGTPIPLGFGMLAEGSEVNGLVLESVDAGRPTAEAMQAFSSTGGYALLFGWGLPQNITATSDGNPMGRMEVIKYSGVNGNQLLIEERGDVAVGALGYTLSDATFQNRNWVMHWNPAGLSGDDPLNTNNQITNKVMVAPISVPAPGAAMTPGFGFLTADPLTPEIGSQFAQLTRLGGESDQTEWVRYDNIFNGHLIRCHPDALRALYFWGIRIPGIPIEANPLAGGGPGAPNPGGGGPSNPLNPGTQGPGGAGTPQDSVPTKSTKFASAEPSSPALSQGTSAPPADAVWDYRWGQAEDNDLFVTRALSSAFQFRGVLGTSSHTHPSGTVINPVFQIDDQNLQGGWPGRFDSVMFLESSAGGGATSVAWPGRVHRALRPTTPHQVHSYIQDPQGDLGVLEGASIWAADQTWVEGQELPINEDGEEEFPPDVYRSDVTYIALEQQPVNPVGEAGEIQWEQRSRARMSKFPSGERPRIVGGATLGGSVVGGGVVPAATVDEVSWGSARFGGRGTGDATAGAQMIFADDLGEAETGGFVAQRGYRLSGPDFGIGTQDVLDDLPQDAGVLRAGDELMVYSQVSAGTGAFTIAPGGRGVLGTDPQPHAFGQSVSFLGFIRVSLLAAPLSSGSSQIVLVNSDGFPYEGTVLIDDELIHYTRKRGNVLEMPARSNVAGAKDGSGDGLFRGRFGTFPRDHAAGTPVFFFDVRYADRWAAGADAPELHYKQFTLDQPGAYWRTTFFEVDESSFGGSRLTCLLKTDPDLPWDTGLFDSGDIELIERGMEDGDGVKINTQSDQIDLRFHVEYLPGAYDAVLGLSHGWKMTPRLRLTGVEYIAPSRLLRRVDR